MTTAAVLGTGAIGAPVARTLAARGVRIRVYDRDTERAVAVECPGIAVAGSAAEAVRGAAVVLVLVLDEAALLEVVDAALPALEPGALVVDMTTTRPEAKRHFAALVREAGVRPAEAPFFGTVPQAESGELFAVVGCADADLPDVERALAPLCSGLFRHGDVGDASALKLAANVLVFPMVELIAEAIALAEAQAVDPEALLRLLAAGTGVRSPIYQARGRMIVDRDFEPRASVALAAKDLELIHETAAGRGLELPLLERTRELYRRALAHGLGECDMAAVWTLLRTARA